MRSRSRFAWGSFGLALVIGAAATFVRFFVIDAVVQPLVVGHHASVEISANELRTFALLPWLPAMELVIGPPRDPTWRTTIREPVRDRAGELAAYDSHAVRDDVLLVRDGPSWRAHDLDDGDERPLSSVRGEGLEAFPELVVAMTGDEWPDTAHAIDRATGRALWTRDLPQLYLPRSNIVAAFGATELRIGQHIVDAATGEPREPIDARFAIAGDDVVWVDETLRAVMRRESGARSRRAIDDPLISWIDAEMVGDTLVLFGGRTAALASDIARRERLERTTIGALHGHDQTIVLALEPDDSMRWLVASAGGIADAAIGSPAPGAPVRALRALPYAPSGASTPPSACALDTNTFGVTLSFVRPGHFERRSFAIDVRTGDVTENDTGCGDRDSALEPD